MRTAAAPVASRGSRFVGLASSPTTSVPGRRRVPPEQAAPDSRRVAASRRTTRRAHYGEGFYQMGAGQANLQSAGRRALALVCRRVPFFRRAAAAVRPASALLGGAAWVGARSGRSVRPDARARRAGCPPACGVAAPRSREPRRSSVGCRRGRRGDSSRLRGAAREPRRLKRSRTAVETLLTFCPPGPEERKKSKESSPARSRSSCPGMPIRSLAAGCRLIAVRPVPRPTPGVAAISTGASTDCARSRPSACTPRSSGAGRLRRAGRTAIR